MSRRRRHFMLAVIDRLQEIPSELDAVLSRLDDFDREHWQTSASTRRAARGRTARRNGSRLRSERPRTGRINYAAHHHDEWL
jgi:hypothetical protein